MHGHTNIKFMKFHFIRRVYDQPNLTGHLSKYVSNSTYQSPFEVYKLVKNLQIFMAVEGLLSCLQ